MLTLIMGGICFLSSPQDPDELRERLKDPAQVWPAFQSFMKEGLYSRAYDLVAPATKKWFPYEAFYITFASYEAPRHFVSRVGVQRAGEGKALLGSSEFGASREIRLFKYLGRIWTLELTPEDIDYFKGRIWAWYRYQVKKADGWHFAYPPDWTYAPLARTPNCGK